MRGSFASDCRSWKGKRMVDERRLRVVYTDESAKVRPKGSDDGEPPDNERMEARVAKLENIAEKTGERLARIEQDLVVIKTQMDSFTKHYATKADVVQAKNSIIMWVVSAILLAQLLPAILAKLTQ